MVAINFTVFVDKVESGEKRRTLRDKPRCKPGDALQLYTGMRNRGCRKLRDAICTSVKKVLLYETHLYVDDLLMIESAHDFALLDGFKGYDEMIAWFKKTYPDEDFPMTMYLHEWQPLPKAVEEEPAKKRHPRPRRYPKKKKAG